MNATVMPSSNILQWDHLKAILLNVKQAMYVCSYVTGCWWCWHKLTNHRRLPSSMGKWWSLSDLCVCTLLWYLSDLCVHTFVARHTHVFEIFALHKSHYESISFTKWIPSQSPKRSTTDGMYNHRFIAPRCGMAHELCAQCYCRNIPIW